MAPHDTAPDLARLRRRNRTVMLILLGVVAGMVGLSFASVPLYSLFCRVTGYGGTTQVASGTTGQVLERTVRVRFTAGTDSALPWRFAPETPEITLHVGEPGLVYFSAENTSSTPIAGVAVYNVSPDKAGLYFTKVQCFCFGEQILNPGQRVDLPVYFFVDPAIADNRNLDDVQTITLSYTFFRARSDRLDRAIRDYYRSIEALSAPETAMLPGQPAAPATPQ